MLAVVVCLEPGKRQNVNPIRKFLHATGKQTKKKQPIDSTSDDPIQVLMDTSPWWFTAFSNVYKLIPELGQGHSSRILDKLTHQGDPSVSLNKFLVRQPVIKLRPVGRVQQQSALSPTEDMVNDLSPKPTRKNYDIAHSIYSHVMRLTSRMPFRTEGECTTGGKGENFNETIVQNINTNPMLPFTLEEEFKVIDMIVRVDDFSLRLFAFMEKNFGSNCFPGYSQLTTENVACTNFAGKLPYNPAVEQRLLKLGEKYTYLNFDIFFHEMRHLSAGVKIKMLKNSYPTGLMILYAILEYNHHMQTQPHGQEQVQQIRMANLERFTSPWALDYADEVKFHTTISKVGEVLGRDLQLMALYTILCMITPWKIQVSFMFLVFYLPLISCLILSWFAGSLYITLAGNLH